MNQVNKRTKGAVSVFLVIILVPCIVVTSVFVDLGRVHMSKSMAESASDLALNSLLTNYDSELNEWYGMVASSQNIDEFYEKSAQFFLRTLSSQGLSDDEIYLLSDYYANATNDDTIYDLLQVECQTDASGMITAVSGANLSNATLIKEQVVEFMKYRAPIELTTSIIERIQNDSSVSETIDADVNKPLVEDKTEYYEAEGELLAAAFNSYVAIFDYYREATSGGLTNEKLQSYASKLNTYKDKYSEIHNLMVSNLLNTNGLSVYHRRVYNLDSYNLTYTKTSDEVFSRKETIDGTDHYYVDGPRINELLSNLETEIADFANAKTSFETAAASLMNKLPGNSDASSNYVQWWVQMNKAVNSSSGTNQTNNFAKAAENMLKAYSKVLAIKDCELGDDIPNDWEERFNTLTNEVVELQGKYLVANKQDTGDAYLHAVKKLEDVSSSNIYNINSSTLYVNVDGQNLTIDQAIPYIKGQISSIRSEMRKYVKLLNIAIDGNEGDEEVPENDRVKSLDQLLALVNTYNTKLTTWKNTAETTGTTMADRDITEINELEQVCQEITSASVGELKTRLSNIRSQLDTIVDAIDSMEYGRKKAKAIDSYSSFKNEAETKVQASNIKLKNSELKSYAQTTFSQLFKPTTTVCTMSHMNDNKYNPIINPDSKQIQTPNLFVYFHERFKGASKQQVNTAQEELDAGEAKGTEKADAAKNKGRYHGGGTEITKEYSGDKTFSLADGAISGVIDLLKSLINLDVTNIRDDLYVTAYIMNMFSFATYEEEGLYSLVEKKNELYLPTSGYRPSQYENLLGNATTEKTWLSEKPTDSFNKSLTNKMINKSNNGAYAAEVEYILYGGRTDKGNNENVKAVYSNIYGIRYALNLVSGFSNYWKVVYGDENTTDDAIFAIASLIQGATSGIIPIPVTKIVLIPILTAFETAKDLDRLEAGFPVELYKSSYKDWWISVPTLSSVADFTNALSNPFNGPNTDKGIYYSDYLTLFVYLGLKSSAEDDMLQRMAEVIQTNIRKQIGPDSTYSLSKSQVYFNLKATIRVKPLMITLPIFNEYSNDMETNTDWCTYTVETTRGY